MPAKSRHSETKKRIRLLRRGGWTMEKIAREVGVALRTVQHWNAGTREIEEESVPRLEAVPLKYVRPAKVSA